MDPIGIKFDNTKILERVLKTLSIMGTSFTQAVSKKCMESPKAFVKSCLSIARRNPIATFKHLFTITATDVDKGSQPAKTCLWPKIKNLRTQVCGIDLNPLPLFKGRNEKVLSPSDMFKCPSVDALIDKPMNNSDAQEHYKVFKVPKVTKTWEKTQRGKPKTTLYKAEPPNNQEPRIALEMLLHQFDTIFADIQSKNEKKFKSTRRVEIENLTIKSLDERLPMNLLDKTEEKYKTELSNLIISIAKEHSIEIKNISITPPTRTSKMKIN